jgi:hypothetical protein
MNTVVYLAFILLLSKTNVEARSIVYWDHENIPRFIRIVAKNTTNVADSFQQISPPEQIISTTQTPSRTPNSFSKIKIRVSSGHDEQPQYPMNEYNAYENQMMVNPAYSGFTNPAYSGLYEEPVAYNQNQQYNAFYQNDNFYVNELMKHLMKHFNVNMPMNSGNFYPQEPYPNNGMQFGYYNPYEHPYNNF